MRSGGGINRMLQQRLAVEKRHQLVLRALEAAGCTRSEHDAAYARVQSKRQHFRAELCEAATTAASPLFAREMLKSRTLMPGAPSALLINIA